MEETQDQIDAMQICRAALPVIISLASPAWSPIPDHRIYNEPDSAVDDALRAYLEARIRIPEHVRKIANAYASRMSSEDPLRQRIEATLKAT
jgi:hypothetical protein